MKVLFLDIDGVLQPCGRQERFAHIDEIPSLCKQLNETVKTDFDYEAYVGNSYSNACDIGAVYFDWDKPSVERLRRILDMTGTRVILSSNWREGGVKRMKGFIAIYNLDSYLDDRNIGKGLDGHFIHTQNFISKEDVQRCIEILNWEDGPFPLDATLHTPELEEWRKKYVQI